MIVLEILTAFFLLVGATLALLAAIGMVRLPDTFLRMQASAKASTLGLACLLVGAAFQLTDVSSVIRLGAIAAFVMVTAPLSAHVVARATLHRGTRLWGGSVLNEYEYEPEDAPEGASPPVSVAAPEAPTPRTDPAPPLAEEPQDDAATATPDPPESAGFGGQRGSA